MPSLTEKGPTQHASVVIAIIQNSLPPSSEKHIFSILFKYFVFKNS